jgi:putative ATPase
VGLADSNALGVAVAASDALQFVGLPEAAFAMTHAALYLSLAPKSNSVTTAMGAAQEMVEGQSTVSVPIHLRDGHYQGAATIGHGDGYRYPHSYPEHVVPQDYFPPEIGDHTFYHPSEQGIEARTKERLQHYDELAKRNRARD